MEDLLNEEDFVVKDEFNYGMYFGIFYALAVVHFCCAVSLFALEEIPDIVILFVILSPTVMTFVMVFYKKKIIQLPLRKILIPAFYILGIYYSLLLFAGFIGSATLNNIFICRGVCSKLHFLRGSDMVYCFK